MGLFDYEFRLEEINKKQPPLQKLNTVIDWELFRKPIEKALSVKAKSPGGRPAFDKLMMFKIIILQRYYNLSDEQCEFQIKDRLSFMDFLGIKLDDKVPDENTIWHFKEKLKEHNLSQTLFDLFTDKLSEQGVVAKTGSMVDASFVDVPRQRNSKGGNDTIKAGGVPIEFGKNKHKLAQKDTNARWAKKNQETHFGYKNHVNVDERSKLINKYCVSSASKHDSQLLEDLVDKDDKQLYADSAYRSEDIERYLRGIKCKSQVHEKGARNNPLSEQQKSNNHKKSKTRVRVEHVFGFMTNSMHDGLHMRQIGQQRIKSCIGLLNLTYNLFRYEQIVRLKIS
jgi:IS5 family transposase